MIAVAGEALIDLLVDPSGSVVALPGGAPFNVVRTLGRLGAACAFVGVLSTDRFGRLLRETLIHDGVDVTTTITTQHPSTLALAELDALGAARYRFYTEGTAAAALSADDARAALSRLAPSTLHVGSLAMALEPIGSAIEAIVASAPSATTIMIDPNCRPDALADQDAWRARLDRVLPRADVIKVSIDDLAHLEPNMPAIKSARRLLLRGPSCVLVTNGAADVLVLTRAKEVEVVPPRAAVVDTIGAGDAFCAGFLAWCARENLAREAYASAGHMQQAVEFAVRVAARVCEHAGAHPSRLDELALVGSS